MIKKHMILHGKVQGVGFRQFTQTEAEKLGVKGWVKNKSDGTVEVKAEGEEKTMNTFIENVRQGHRFSSVQNVDISDTDTVEHNGSFSVTF
ncbi:acylphosphatase [Salibacterium salarium]|uniref:Acylphosphatase n=1 Tax=Salibacterium salarium TaxID=284579 RepID=A0A428N7J4_9BACI|nr:acylphosphatase [Salibacterium salarium]RSL34347.1 acylphosphatase [Salibacterium salarium]